MAEKIRARSARAALLGVPLLLFGLVLGTGSALAATTPFHGTYDERTTPVPCPPGTPPGAFCFTGVGTGPTTPPGGVGVERYAGYADVRGANPLTGCAPDYNAVSISTSSGTLFLTTSNTCPGGVNNATWTAQGGTGIFEGANGGGPVTTQVLGYNADGTIHSISTYAGVLSLNE